MPGVLRGLQNEFEFLNLAIEHARIRGERIAKRGISLPDNLDIGRLHLQIEKAKLGQVIQLLRHIVPQQRMKCRQRDRVAGLDAQVVAQAGEPRPIKVEICSDDVVREKHDMDRLKQPSIGSYVKVRDHARLLKLRQSRPSYLAEAQRLQRHAPAWPGANRITVIIDQVTAGGTVRERQCVDRRQSQNRVESQGPAAATHADVSAVEVNFSFECRRRAVFLPSHRNLTRRP